MEGKKAKDLIPDIAMQTEERKKDTFNTPPDINGRRRHCEHVIASLLAKINSSLTPDKQDSFICSYLPKASNANRRPIAHTRFILFIERD